MHIVLFARYRYYNMREKEKINFCNNAKYPVEKAKDSAKKYDEL